MWPSGSGGNRPEALQPKIGPTLSLGEQVLEEVKAETKALVGAKKRKVRLPRFPVFWTS